MRHKAATYIERKFAMNKCPKCGNYIPEGGKMCIACGWKPEENDGAILELLKDNPYINAMQEVMGQMKKDDNTGEYQGLPHDNTPWIAAASYLGPAFLYTYFVKGKDSELVRYHANQACVLFGAEVLAKVFYKNRIPVIGNALKKASNLMFFVLAFMGARAAVADKQKPLPVLGELKLTILK